MFSIIALKTIAVLFFTTSPGRYYSSCEQKKTYVMALVRQPMSTFYDWNWIQLDSGCECAVTQRFDELFPLE